MSSEFKVEVITHRGVLLSEDVDSVVLPAHDGQCGILANHEEFMGVLGCGLLETSNGDNKSCLVVDSGVYEVKGGKLTVLAELAQRPEDVNLEATESRLEELDSIFSDHDRFCAEDYPAQSREHSLLKARLEALQRMG